MTDNFQTGKVPRNVAQFNLHVGNDQSWNLGIRANSQNFDYLPLLIGFSVGLLIVGFFSYNSYDIEDSYMMFGILGGLLFTYGIYEAVNRSKNQYNVQRRINSNQFVAIPGTDAYGNPIIQQNDPTYRRFKRSIARLNARDQQSIRQSVAQNRSSTGIVGARYGPGSRMAVGADGNPFSAMNLSIADRPGLAGSMRRMPVY